MAWIALGVMAMTVPLVGCSDGPAVDGGRESTVVVAAASSLTRVMTRIARDFEASNPGVRVELSFAGSATLATQVEQGLTFDVLALADEASMSRVVEAGGADPRDVGVFATNSMAIVVRDGNPAGIRGPADLARTGIRFVMCESSQPCGAYAIRVLDATGIDPAVASLETSVSGVVGRVARGEADAGLVYATDGASDGVELVAIPSELNVIARYPIALAANPVGDGALARSFVEFVMSPDGRVTLIDQGFGVP